MATYKYLGPNAVVVTAIMNEAAAITGGRATWRYRSPVLSACHAFARMAMTAIKYGGVVNRSVVMLFLPRPLTTVGKNVVTVPADVNP